jgi:XTP/dITP diphosphohydrolase
MHLRGMAWWGPTMAHSPTSSRLRAVLCSGNAHKVEELAELLPVLELRALDEPGRLPPETGDTFEANARIKAIGGATLLGADRQAWVVADDSGLEVDALGGAPGVYSARFAGEDATDEANTQLLLERLEQLAAEAAVPPTRTARFVCVLVALAPDGRELVARGTVDGRIAHAPAGDAGFGYDPVFVPAGHDATFAELGSDVKQSMSHRARAAAELARLLVAAGQDARP